LVVGVAMIKPWRQGQTVAAFTTTDEERGIHVKR
jgi:hypothetical protein